jgi:hypothetical protein
MFSCSATCIYNSSSSSFGTKWFINSLAIGCPTKIVPMFLEELDVQNIITILNCQTSFLCLRTINEIKTISMRKTCMKILNLKCDAIIEISYGQTLQLCAYNFTFRSPIFPMFVNVIMQI